MAYIIVLIVVPIVLVGIAWMYLIESDYLDGFKFDDYDDEIM